MKEVRGTSGGVTIKVTKALRNILRSRRQKAGEGITIKATKELRTTLRSRHRTAGEGITIQVIQALRTTLRRKYQTGGKIAASCQQSYLVVPQSSLLKTSRLDAIPGKESAIMT